MMKSSDECVISKKIDSENFSDRQISYSIYIIRCIAILSVIAAHVNIVDNSNCLSTLITHIWGVLSCFGVPAFLITGGYYYHRDKNDSKIYWQKKLHSVIIPWVIASFVTYSVFSFLRQSLSVVDYFKWFIGSGTFHYYMTIYVVMLVIFKFIRRTPYLVALIILMFGSLFLEQLHFYGNYGGFGMTKYLNPLNWVGYFAFGILIKKYGLEKKVKNWVIVVSFVALLFLSLIECRLNELSYFSLFNPLTQTFLLISIYGLIKYLFNIKFIRCEDGGGIMLFVAQNSLVIYLYHMQIVQFILNRLPKFGWTQLIKPVLGLVIMTLLVYVACFILKRFSYGSNIMKCVGLKYSVPGKNYEHKNRLL